MIHPKANEAELRTRLGIPHDADQVLVFGESSHWDTNWLRTSEEYYAERVASIFEAVMAALARDPRRVFCIESLFFLRLYWERRPDRREILRALLGSGQLRLIGASVTTPDTLLPPTETVFRDYLAGQQWLRSVELPLEPRVAYFPDNFGHSPTLPTLMQALGIDAVGLTRIDGMYFIGADYRSRKTFPWAGSTAHLLQRELKTLDFVWKGSDGAEVLCHWNAFTYFQGDMLAHLGVIRWMGKTFGIPWRTSAHIGRRIDAYARSLGELSLTPYRFCPIGCDFNDPILDLNELLDRYNRQHYPATGVFAVLAGLDDYFALLDSHRAKLPVLSVDPNPYWMGFYSSRPEVKRRPARIAELLLATEQLSAGGPPDTTRDAHLQEGWERLVLSNHHDFITGTSPDRVWLAEQRPWLDAAEVSATAAWARIAAQPRGASVARSRPRVRWHQRGDKFEIETEEYRLVLDARRGGCLTSWRDASGHERLDGLGFDLLSHRDSGGLWRLGHEFMGGHFRPRARASDARAKITVSESDAGLCFEMEVDLGGMPFTRWLWCSGEQPFLKMRIRGAAKPRTTVTCRFDTATPLTELTMDSLGGEVERPHRRHYDPTFWPVSSWLGAKDTSARACLAWFDVPTAVAVRAETALEWIVARNAHKELAFGFFPVLAHPIGGTTHDAHTLECALALDTANRPGSGTRFSRDARLSGWFGDAAHPWHHADAGVQCDSGVSVVAVKAADRGDGVIVRLLAPRMPLMPIGLVWPKREIRRAFLCDARERDLRELSVAVGRVEVPVPQTLSTVRLILAS